jgi:peptidyl-prolyl cis-trans isomerase C
MLCLRKYKNILTVTVLSVLSFPLMAFAADETPSPKVTADAGPKAVADVNGKAIPYADFQRQLEMFKQQVTKGQPGQLPEDLKKRLQSQVVDKMIADELLFQQAEKNGIKIESEAVHGEIKKIKSRFKDEQEYHSRLKGVGLSEDKLKGQIKRRVSITKLIEKEILPAIKINDQDAKTYYDANLEKFNQPERVRARHILMKVEKGDSEDKKTAAKKKLQDIQKRILAGEDFSKLAKENSQGPSNVKGGDLGYFTKGRMVKSFEDVAFKLAPNEVSDIVETQFGYHLIKVIDRQAAGAQPYEKMKEKIKSHLFNEQVQKKMEPYVKTLREKAKVEVYIK